MNSVERLELAIAEAEKRGFAVRMEPLQGAAGGLCEFGRKKWIFIDITAPVLEQLDQLLSALRAKPPVMAKIGPSADAA